MQGENILAIQAHDDSVNSYGFALHVELLANIVRGPVIESTTSTDTKSAWQALKPTTSVVEYGPTTSLGQRIESEILTTDHVLQLLDLKPDTTYHYRVGGVAGEIPCFSKTTSFKTLKPSGPVRLMLLGDDRVDGVAKINSIRKRIGVVIAPSVTCRRGDREMPKEQLPRL